MKNRYLVSTANNWQASSSIMDLQLLFAIPWLPLDEKKREDHETFQHTGEIKCSELSCS
jgi:hypothetical protein